MEDDSVICEKPKSLLTKEVTNDVEELEVESVREYKKSEFTNNIHSKIDIEMSNKIPKLHGMQFNDNTNNTLTNNANRYSISINDPQKGQSTNNQNTVSKNTSVLLSNNIRASNIHSDNNHAITTNVKSSKKNVSSEKKKDKVKKDKGEKKVKMVEDRSPNPLSNNNINNNTNNHTTTIKKRVKFRNPFIDFVNIESYKLYNSLMCFSDPHTEPKPTKCKCTIL